MIQILYFLRNPAQQTQLQALCNRSGLSCRAFQQGDAGKPIVSLLQPGTGTRKPAAAAVPLLWQAPEFILMCGLGQGQMEAFLDSCSGIGISRDVLKAMVTPFNVSWTVYALLTQLQAEHRALQNH